MTTMNKLKLFLYMIRVLPIMLGVKKTDYRFQQDLIRWKNVCNISESRWIAFAELMWQKKEFRNLYIYRNSHRPIYRRWVALWYKPMDTLYFDTPEIGGGLFIQHGFATMIAAKSIGENCWINQQVTIGYKDNTVPPTLGDNVVINCGAKVLGPINVGDGAIIGANAVVIRDVEPGAVMGGVPAKKIR